MVPFKKSKKYRRGNAGICKVAMREMKVPVCETRSNSEVGLMALMVII